MLAYKFADPSEFVNNTMPTKDSIVRTWEDPILYKNGFCGCKNIIDALFRNRGLYCARVYLSGDVLFDDNEAQFYQTLTPVTDFVDVSPQLIEFSRWCILRARKRHLIRFYASLAHGGSISMAICDAFSINSAMPYYGGEEYIQTRKRWPNYEARFGSDWGAWWTLNKQSEQEELEMQRKYLEELINPVLS